MSDVKPLVGWMILENYTDDMSQWDGVITFPDPTGANLAWESPIKMIEHNAYDAVRVELDQKEFSLQNTFERWQNALAREEKLEKQLAEAKKGIEGWGEDAKAVRQQLASVTKERDEARDDYKALCVEEGRLWKVRKNLEEQLAAERELMLKMSDEFRRTQEERDQLREQVKHWKEARQSALDAGEIMKAEVELLTKQVLEFREICAELDQENEERSKDYQNLCLQLAAERERADKAEADLIGRPADVANGWRRERDQLRAEVECLKAQCERLERENVAYFNALQEITEEGHADCEYCLKHDRIATGVLAEYRRGNVE